MLSSSAVVESHESIPYCDVFMRLALLEAARALHEREVPVGAMLVPLPLNTHAAALARRARAHTTGTTSAAAAAAGAVADEAAADTEDRTRDEWYGLWRTYAPLAHLASSPEATEAATLATASIAFGRNATNRRGHALAHAEFIAAERLCSHGGGEWESAAEALGSAPHTAPPDLSGHVLYVTVEPCIMCAAFLRYNRIAHVFYGIGNPRFGGTGSVLAIHELRRPTPASSPPCRDRGGEGMADGAVAGEGPGSDYVSVGGHRAREAVELLQQFYAGENPNAPGEKRKRKRAS